MNSWWTREELEYGLEDCGAKLVGETSVEGYTYESSKAQRGEVFVGLALDQENQARLTNGRVSKWVEQLKKEFFN